MLVCQKSVGNCHDSSERIAWLLEGRGSERKEEKDVVLRFYIYVQSTGLKETQLPDSLSTLILLTFSRERLESTRRVKMM